MVPERLHKVLAAAGVASRRECERLIAEGHVTVDGDIIRTMGVRVDLDSQDVRFDGERIRPEKPVYYLVYKPTGYLSTNQDPQGRPTVVSLVQDRQKRRLYTVGRLDEDSEGLILVTNDGDFANQVAHPRYGVEKTYALKLHGSIDNDALQKARDGVWLAEGRTNPMNIRLLKRSKSFSHVVVRIREGKNRQLRRVFARAGYAVAHLKRVRIGPLSVQGMKRREVRRLTAAEVKAVLASCGPNAVEATAARPSSRRPGPPSGRGAQRGPNKSRPGSSSQRPGPPSGRGAPRGPSKARPGSSSRGRRQR